MACISKFYRPDHDPLSEFFLRARCFTFRNLGEFLTPYYLHEFPPRNRPNNDSSSRKSTKTTERWRRNCNFATEHRLELLKQQNTVVEYAGRHRHRMAPDYPGAWLESDFTGRVDLSAISEAFYQDLQDLKSAKPPHDEFYSASEFRRLIEDAHSDQGRSEFVDSQLTLASFYVHLSLSTDRRHRRIANTWRLLPLGDCYETYSKQYCGDAVAEDEHGELLICSPMIHGWWTPGTVGKALSELFQRLAGTRCILLAPKGFHAWNTEGPVDPSEL